MKTRHDQSAQAAAPVAAARRVVTVFGWSLLVVLVVATAVMAKRARTGLALMQIEHVGIGDTVLTAAPVIDDEELGATLAEPVAAPAGEDLDTDASLRALCSDASVRWFNGRPAKPYRVITMTVTAYSPDAQSCGQFADGKTATLHSVETNGGHLVAADPTLLPYGSMLSIPGYAGGQIVPVLDCGGAIKGRHIDLLFPTHEQARQWGVKKLKVLVWRYVDGKPAGDPRKAR